MPQQQPENPAHSSQPAGFETSRQDILKAAGGDASLNSNADQIDQIDWFDGSKLPDTDDSQPAQPSLDYKRTSSYEPGRLLSSMPRPARKTEPDNSAKESAFSSLYEIAPLDSPEELAHKNDIRDFEILLEEAQGFADKGKPLKLDTWKEKYNREWENKHNQGKSNTFPKVDKDIERKGIEGWWANRLFQIGIPPDHRLADQFRGIFGDKVLRKVSRSLIWNITDPKEGMIKRGTFPQGWDDYLADWKKYDSEQNPARSKNIVTAAVELGQRLISKPSRPQRTDQIKTEPAETVPPDQNPLTSDSTSREEEKPILDEEVIDVVQGPDGKWTAKSEKTAGRLKNIGKAAVELGKRIDGVQLFGLHLTDFFAGMAIGWTSRTLAKGALIATTGGVGYGGAMIAGGVAGAITGAAREYIKQVRENIKEAPVTPGLEQGRLSLKETLRVNDQRKLIVATGKGLLMGTIGGFAGSYVLEHGGDWLNNLRHIGENHSGGGVTEVALPSTETPTATATAIPDHTPTPTATAIPTETQIPTSPTDLGQHLPLPDQPIIEGLLHQNIQIEPGSSFWQSFNVPHEYFPSGTSWVNSANGVTQSDVIKDMVAKFATANGHNLSQIPPGLFSLNSLGLTPEQMEIINAAAHTTNVEDYRINVMPGFQSILEKVK